MLLSDCEGLCSGDRPKEIKSAREFGQFVSAVQFFFFLFFFAFFFLFLT